MSIGGRRAEYQPTLSPDFAGFGCAVLTADTPVSADSENEGKSPHADGGRRCRFRRRREELPTQTGDGPRVALKHADGTEVVRSRRGSTCIEGAPTCANLYVGSSYWLLAKPITKTQLGFPATRAPALLRFDVGLAPRCRRRPRREELPTRTGGGFRPAVAHAALSCCQLRDCSQPGGKQNTG